MPKLRVCIQITDDKEKQLQDSAKTIQQMCLQWQESRHLTAATTS